MGWVGVRVSGRSASVEAVDAIRGAFVSEDLAWTASDPIGTAEYASARYSRVLDATRASLPDWRAYEGLRAVLDVRTVMEDPRKDLSDNLPPAILADIAAATKERGFQPWALSDSIVEWLLLVLRRADAETVSLMRYFKPIEDGINAVIGNPVTRRATSD
jgi:hypothetical protein